MALDPVSTAVPFFELVTTSTGGTVVCMPSWLLGLLVTVLSGYGVGERWLRVRERGRDRREAKK